MSRSLSRSLLFLAALSLGAEQLPRTKAVGQAGDILWVSGESLVVPGGDLNLSALPAADAQLIKNYLKVSPTADCIQIGGVIADYANDTPPESLEQALQRAAFVVEGKVTGLEAGFYRGVPGQLVRLEVSKKYRDIEPQARPSTLYVFFPVGDFTVGKYHFCKTDQRFPSPPHVGDSVYFAGGLPLGRDSDILHARHAPQVVVVDGASGQVRVSSDLANRGSGLPHTEQELRRRIAEVTREAPFEGSHSH